MNKMMATVNVVPIMRSGFSVADFIPKIFVVELFLTLGWQLGSNYMKPISHHFMVS